MSFWAEVNQSIGAKLYSTTSFLRQPVNQLPAAMSPADITLITRGKIPLNLEKFRPLVPAEIMTLAGSLPNWKQKSRPDQVQLYHTMKAARMIVTKVWLQSLQWWEDWQTSIVCGNPMFVKLYGDFSRYEQVVNK